MTTNATTAPAQATGQQRFRVLSENGGVITALMSLHDWIATEDHPRRRDIGRHARAPHWRLAHRATGPVRETLRRVDAALFEDTLYKVKGHTRAHLWQTGDLPPPETLHVTIYKARTKSELHELYTVFHTPSTALRAIDQVYGAYRESGLELTSKRLRDGAILDALNIALRGAAPSNQERGRAPLDVYKAVAVFKDELRLLDSVRPQPEVFYTGVVAASLIGLALHPEHALEFLRRLASRTGNKQDGKLDPVEALLTYIATLPQQRRAWIKVEQEKLCARSWRALVAWTDTQLGKNTRYWFANTLRTLDPAPFIEEIKQKKGILDDPQL